jgi:hypothetical protein
MFETHGRPLVPKVALLLMQGDVVLDSVRAKIQEIRDKGKNVVKFLFVSSHNIVTTFARKCASIFFIYLIKKLNV